MADWVDRIEEKKREVEKRFRTFLGASTGSLPAFGRIDLHVWDTAHKRPALRGRAAQAEPYHVAELFRQVFHQHQRTRERALLVGVDGNAVRHRPRTPACAGRAHRERSSGARSSMRRITSGSSERPFGEDSTASRLYQTWV